MCINQFFSLKILNFILLFPDMFLDEAESSTFIRSWIGQPVKFICAIILKSGVDSPSFTWKNVDKNITITENIFHTRTKSVLTIDLKTEKDFGSYKCYARTAHTKIKHNMTLIKIGKLYIISSFANYLLYFYFF